MRARQTFNTPTFESCARAMCVGLALAAAAAVASSAGAQPFSDQGRPDMDEIIVSGPIGFDGGPTRLSRTVDLSDLDLTTPEDQKVLQLRIRDVAHDLCGALEEEPGTGGASPIVPSCQTQAMRDARPQVREAISQAYDRARYASQDQPDVRAAAPR